MGFSSVLDEVVSNILTQRYQTQDIVLETEHYVVFRVCAYTVFGPIYSLYATSREGVEERNELVLLDMSKKPDVEVKQVGVVGWFMINFKEPLFNWLRYTSFVHKSKPFIYRVTHVNLREAINVEFSFSSIIFIHRNVKSFGSIYKCVDSSVEKVKDLTCNEEIVLVEGVKYVYIPSDDVFTLANISETVEKLGNVSTSTMFKTLCRDGKHVVLTHVVKGVSPFESVLVTKLFYDSSVKSSDLPCRITWASWPFITVSPSKMLLYVKLS